MLRHQNAIFKRRHIKAELRLLHIHALHDKPLKVQRRRLRPLRATRQLASSMQLSACLLRSSRRLRAEPRSSAGVTSSLYATGERCEPPGVGARSSLQSLCEQPGDSSTLLGASSGRFLGLPPGMGNRNQSEKPRKALASQPSFEDAICEMPSEVL